MRRSCLLDDVLSELDAERAGGFLAAVGRFEQALSHHDRSCRRAFRGAALFRIAAGDDRRVLTKLGSALGGWRPSGGRAGRSAGHDSRRVGRDRRRRRRARRAAGRAERHRRWSSSTASGAWSHQLSFLEREIVRSVVGAWASRTSSACVSASGRFAPRAARPGGGAVATAPRRAGAPASRTPRRRRWRGFARVVETPARRASRRRRRVLRALRRRRSRPATRCRPVRRRRRSATQREQCERILFEAPWLDPEAVLARRRRACAPTPTIASAGGCYALGLTSCGWRANATRSRPRSIASRVRKLASSYVLLETRIDPNRLELDSPVRRNALGDLYAFIREVETEHARTI